MDCSLLVIKYSMEDFLQIIMAKEIKIEERKESATIYEASCPYCGKKMEQAYKQQLIHNMQVHMMSCSENPDNKGDKK